VHFLVTCRLASPLAGSPPALDALLESALSLYHPKAEPGYKIDRAGLCPPPGTVPIPLLRRGVRGHDGRLWPVAACSDPILPVAEAECVEHVAKRIGVEDAGLLSPAARVVVSTSNSWTKSYRLPLRVRRVECIRWFASGNRRETLKVLRRIHAVGKKIADGYGRVAAWEVEEVAEDRSWFARSEAGLVLMRTLPAGDYLPADLLGSRADFGAAVPPLWHPERYTEIITPC
jgi:hypothetical protein